MLVLILLEKWHWKGRNSLRSACLRRWAFVCILLCHRCCCSTCCCSRCFSLSIQQQHSRPVRERPHSSLAAAKYHGLLGLARLTRALLQRGRGGDAGETRFALDIPVYASRPRSNLQSDVEWAKMNEKYASISQTQTFSHSILERC